MPPAFPQCVRPIDISRRFAYFFDIIQGHCHRFRHGGFHMKCLLLCLVLFASLVLAKQPPDEFRGKLNPDLSPNRNFQMTIRFDPLPDSDRVALPGTLGPHDTILCKHLKWPPDIGKPFLVYLVDPPHGRPVLYADVDQNGSISPDERFPLSSFHADPETENDLVVWLPYRFAGTMFDRFPVTFRPASVQGTSREVSYSNVAFATGSVDIDGRQVLVQYGIDAATGSVSPKFEGLGIDGNEDGKIDFSENSPETDYGNRGEVIFHVGQRYVSTLSVDSATGVVVMRSHPASEYTRVELTAGTQLPDFSFTDLAGKLHKLSDYRGKYVLLDFWATWCSPCVKEVPFLKAIYGKFHRRNFEIVGMDMENGWDPATPDEMKKFADKAKAFITEHGIGWPQARTSSIAQLVNDRFRVNSYPMKLLLDPEGRILLRQGSGGHGELISLLSSLVDQAGTNPK
jgi:thiol-disulfide isomerase/thioredoxin